MVITWWIVAFLPSDILIILCNSSSRMCKGFMLYYGLFVHSSGQFCIRITSLTSEVFLVFLVQVRLRKEVLCNPSSTHPGFELMTFRS